MRKQLTALLLTLVLGIALLPAGAFADGEPYVIPVNVNGEQKSVRAYDESYEGNLYLSLTDLAAALSSTEKRFRFERIVSSTDGEYFVMADQRNGGKDSRYFGIVRADEIQGIVITILRRNNL